MMGVARMVACLGALLLAPICLNTAVAATPDAAAKADLVQRGRYLATAGDCVGCHTAPGGKPFAGGLPLATPFGAIIGTNVTPSKTHGIGNYTLTQFADAVRKGIRADGAYLYPAMPYAAYSIINDSDMLALYTYFMSAVAPVDAAAPRTNLAFPFNIRLSMAVWNWLFLKARTFESDPAKSVAWNRGAYLVLGLGHCGDCHTPRNLLMGQEQSRDLAGTAVGPWYAPNITSDANSGIGSWSERELVDYMRTGQIAKAQAGGPMTEVIDNSLRHLTDADLQATAVYLKTVPAIHDPADTRPVTEWGSASDELSSIRGVALPSDPDQMTGAQLYDAYCATCHQDQGQGSFDGGLPRLFHTAALGRTNTNNMIMVTLSGIGRHSEVLMPPFGKELSDHQIATLGAYLVRHFGNPKAVVTVEQVKTLRTNGPGSWLIVAARVALGVVAVLIVGGLLVLVFWFRRRTPGNKAQAAH